MRPRTPFPSSIGAFLRQLFLIVAISALGTAESRAQAPVGPEQLDALTAPIALYSDTLLAQVLIASTYPAEVAQAGQWAQQNSSLQGAALDNALQQQPWDPSVKALVQVPTVLQQMNSRMDWNQQLGDAFLAQQADVMDSVQRLRQRAQGAGQLMTTEQQVVVTEGAGASQTIVIEQANPQVMYVPSYQPQVVYGGWPLSVISALLLADARRIRIPRIRVRSRLGVGRRFRHRRSGLGQRVRLERGRHQRQLQPKQLQ